MIRIVGKNKGRYYNGARMLGERLGCSHREAMGLIVDLTLACHDQRSSFLKEETVISIANRSQCLPEDYDLVSDLVEFGFANVNRSRSRSVEILGSDAPHPSTPTRMRTYFVRARDTDMIKIGRAADVKQRISDLQVACPYPLDLLVSVVGDFEKHAHKRFKTSRLHGEWFSLSGVIATIRSTYTPPHDFRCYDDKLDAIETNNAETSPTFHEQLPRLGDEP